MRRASLILSAAIVASCMSATPSLPASTAVPLPTDPFWIPDAPCLGTRFDFILHGDPEDPNVTWGEDTELGGGFDLVWPVGYTATFDPELRLLDERGQPSGRAGDIVIGGCPEDPETLEVVRILVDRRDVASTPAPG